MRMTFLALGLATLAGLYGCSDPDPVDRTESGTLEEGDDRVRDDNSPYDSYEFRAAEGWRIVLDMESSAFDTYLWLLGPSGESLEQDDDAGEGTNSHIERVAPTGGTYTVRANSYDETGRGAYTLHIVAGPAGQENE